MGVSAFIECFLFYFRLFGSYEALDGGRLTEALEDFTGGISDSLDLEEMKVESSIEERVKLFDRLEHEMENRTMMGASIPVSHGVKLTQTLTPFQP